MTLRPTNHFTPPKNWMNDPNGLVFHNGIYHLYYQHNPYENKFGHISWGHATSSDLKKWNHQKVALESSPNTMIYSGCTIVDHQDRICAIYTEHLGNTEIYHEKICLAISLDGGFSFQQNNRQVILEHKEKDFRDPQVFWYAPQKCWVMCVALPKKYTILFYQSIDLINWEQTGSFTSKLSNNQFWECPNLFQLTNDQGETHWVLSLSGENVDGHSWGMFYFLGTFDGRQFKATSPSQPLDFGSDYYAGITFLGHSKTIMLAWAGNWAYAGKLKEIGWSGMLNSPRLLTIKGNSIQQRLITDIQPQKLKITSQLQSLHFQNCTLSWSKSYLEIDRSDSALDFPADQKIISISTAIQSIEVYLDNGIIELSLNAGESLFSVRC